MDKESVGKWYPKGNVSVRGKWNKYSMLLDTSNIYDRSMFFTARFFELETELVARRLLRTGDTVIDVGANRGWFTMTCCQIVGKSGKVIAFEPNPAESQHIREQVASNHITNAEVEQCGLSDEDALLDLHLIDSVSALASFAKPNDRINDSMDIRSVRVPVHTGDAMLKDRCGDNTLLKIDVEGFEYRVLRGLESTIGKIRPAIYLEVEPEWLSRADSSVDQLISWISTRGYKCFVPTIRGSSVFRRIVLHSVENDRDIMGVREKFGNQFRNVLAIHPESIFSQRMRQF